MTPDGVLLAGRYRLGELLGTGGMADVYRAVDERLGRSVAVKVFRPSSEPLGERARFTFETRTLAALSHPGLVTLFDAGFEDDRPYLVMQLVEGRTLSEVLRAEGALTEDTVARIGAQLAGALDHVHSSGVVHRDLKPGNVLLDGQGRPYLADFGIARLVDATSVTASGALVGTAAYLAPEQVTNRSAGPASDVYSLGLVLLECLTGRREYVGRPLEVALARVSRPPQVPDDLPRRWRSLLAAMMATDPVDRPSAAEVAAVLRGGAEEDAALAGLGAMPGGSVSPAGRRSVLGVRSALAVLVSIAALGLLLVAFNGPADTPSDPSGPDVPAPPSGPSEISPQDPESEPGSQDGSDGTDRGPSQRTDGPGDHSGGPSGTPTGSGGASSPAPGSDTPSSSPTATSSPTGSASPSPTGSTEPDPDPDPTSGPPLSSPPPPGEGSGDEPGAGES